MFSPWVFNRRPQHRHVGPAIASSSPLPVRRTQGMLAPKPKRIIRSMRMATRPRSPRIQPHHVGRRAARRHEVDQGHAPSAVSNRVSRISVSPR